MRGQQRRARAGMAVGLALAIVTAGGGSAAAAGTEVAGDPARASGTLATSHGLDVIVQGRGAEAAVRRQAGTVTRRLAVIDGVAARLPDRAAAAAVSRARDVTAVTVDGELLAMDERWGDDTTGEDEESTLLAGTWVPQHDQGSSFAIARNIGVHDVWSQSAPDNGSVKLTGDGVGVALLDTGVAPVEGLATDGKLVNGPDLSMESQADNTRYLDGFGHGTHMAGLIAGRDSAVVSGNEADEDHFVGMAPDARLVSVKLGTADGGVDVSQVIAGIDWVVSNRGAHNIRVLNLSYGTDSTQSVALDPLAHAVENAWRAGIVVVVAAGNDGEDGPRPLTMPAIDPYVIAVGSSDHHGTHRPEDLRVGTWTNSGTDSRRPDLLAPGKSVVSLRVPGSFADLGHPEGLVYGDVSQRMFRGTGTSQSAAVVSGTIALLLQRNPELTPDQVKGVLKASADPLRNDASPVQGAGQIDAKGALEILKQGSVPAHTQSSVPSTGLGSLDLSRGGAPIVDPEDGAHLTGEQDIHGVPWDAGSWAVASSAGTAWQDGTWRGIQWAGDGWDGDSWQGRSWSGRSWSGRSWSGRSWSGRSWSTMTFLGRSWSGDDWSGRSWSADQWSGRSWSTHDAW